MEKIDREDIAITSKHSNRSRKQIEYLLEQYVYAKPKDWKKFLDLLLLVLGIGFVVSGIIFFFAFNWAELNKFIKIGVILLLLIICITCSFQLKIKEIYKKILITAAAMLVGVLFAVFGQIYQTGANAYDFFLAWTIFITIWVITTHFYPLWLIYMVLINTTIILFNDQVQNNLNSIALYTLLFFLNGIACTALLALSKYYKTDIPLWFRNTLVLTVTSIATVGISLSIFDSKLQQGLLLIIGTLVFYAYCMKYAQRNKSTFFIGTIGFSLLIIVNSILIHIFKEDFIFFFISIFVIITVTALIKFLLNLQRKWTNEK
ncbi:DUF2157 domain-containing protein [Sphingobacterium sp. KU25419]|nr:DUF2157 domain-containing protein [Sphingobacterium sp. KU25419]